MAAVVVSARDRRARVGQVAVAIAIAIAILLGPRQAAAQLLSPGPLSRAHGALEGDQSCNRCHSSGKRVDGGACLTCHADLGARITAGAGLHGRAYRGKPCEGCHVEHQGVGARLVRWPGGDPTKLDHAQTGWPLTGAHKRAACGQCHGRVNGRGAPTFLGVSSACSSCHQDPHAGRFGPTCNTCHDDASWKNLRLTTFNHDLARFKLRGAHRSVGCTKCHSDPPRFTGLAFDSCTSCHKDPHRGKLGRGCSGCHSENGWRPASLRPGAHPGTSLANGHANVACRTCHDRGNLVAPSKGTTCSSCHRPVHKAPFGNACGGCHGSIQWVGLPASVGLAVHGRTAYPLTGKHESVRCAGCHKPEKPRAARYRGLAFSKCGDCHADAHRGEFAARSESDQKAFGSECRTCHTTAGFRPTRFNVAMHAKTAFPLVGKHIATACSACHTTRREAKARAGDRVDLRLVKQECAECHQNPHGDHFAAEMKEGGCAHCHRAAGWDLPKFDHASWPLTGAHASARCESCHSPTPEDKKSGHGPSWRDAPKQCAGCHEDVHAGQFRAAPQAESRPESEGACDRCHETTVFTITRFDHAAIARWPLTGAHANAACDKCHEKTSLKDGSTRIRWRLPSNECRFCHADPHEKRSAR